MSTAELLLIGVVAAVGVLHTIVPDHWVPITLFARQRAWSRRETMRAALQASAGHVASTLLIAMLVWFAGVELAASFGQFVSALSSAALILFGGWIAISAWRGLNGHGHGHRHGGHSHGHALEHRHGPLPDGSHGHVQDHVHGPECRRIDTESGVIDLSIVEEDGHARFRATGAIPNMLRVETHRPGGISELFLFANHGKYWESVEVIPEPHQFDVTLTLTHRGHTHVHRARFSEDGGDGSSTEHSHAEDESLPADDPLYEPLRGEQTVLTRHMHLHRHGAAHAHWHDHAANSLHPLAPDVEAAPPAHEHRHKMSGRTALLLILGSSPMVEGIPAFFAAGKYGIGLIAVMSVVFALSTMATYVILCVYSVDRLQRLRLGAVERYGEVLSGAIIAALGLIFLIWPL